jgi:hypothetical protein
MKTLILLVFLIFQNASQYALYSSYGSGQKFIGVISIDKDNLYIRVTGYLPDGFKIIFVEKKHNGTTYYITNNHMKGYIMISSNDVILEILIDNQVRKYHKFYRKYENRH